MLRRFGYLPLPTRALILAIAALALLVVGATLALAVVNRTVVVAAADSAVLAANRLCPCEVSVAGARYRLFRGLELSEPEVRFASPTAVVRARSARIRVGLGGLLRARGFLSGGVDARAGDFWETLREFGEGGAIPRAIVLDDVIAELADPTFSLPLSRVAWDAIDVRSLPDDGRIEIDAGASGLSPVGFFATMDYRAEIVSTRTTLRGLPLAPLGADYGEFDLELDATRSSSGDLDVAGRLVVRDLVATMPAVASERIGPVHLDYEFAARLQPDFAMSPQFQSPPVFPVPPTSSGLLEFQRGHLVVNGVAMEVLPSLRGFPIPRAIGLQVRLPQTPV
ncbi:MAG TPA: hypothetical protein VKA06_10080, partial [Spirochaetia bacterium]|nr:hypothetical protein [Spirochaetia bacterium]